MTLKDLKSPKSLQFSFCDACSILYQYQKDLLLILILGEKAGKNFTRKANHSVKKHSVILGSLKGLYICGVTQSYQQILQRNIVTIWRHFALYITMYRAAGVRLQNLRTLTILTSNDNLAQNQCSGNCSYHRGFQNSGSGCYAISCNS